MSIKGNSSQNESITVSHQALKYFVDRHDLISLFIKYLNNELPYEKILYFHGDGGNGKSLLLNFIQEYYCKKIPISIWSKLSQQSNTNIVSYVHSLQEHECENVPSILLDFAWKQIGNDQPQHPFYGLIMLQKLLVSSIKSKKDKFKSPLFSYGCFLYLYKTGKVGQIHGLFPSEEAVFINELANIFTEIPGFRLLKSIINLAEKHYKPHLRLFIENKKFDEDFVKRLNLLKPESGLIEELPKLLAEDLNRMVNIKKNKDNNFRIVLLFDAHEKFWGSERIRLQGEEYFIRDEWLRTFLCHLELSDGIITVVAGREPPKWHLAIRPGTIIGNQYLQKKLVPHLSDKDSNEYLDIVGIKDNSLRTAIIKESSLKHNCVHPLHLGICIDYINTIERIDKTINIASLFDEDFYFYHDLSKKRRILINRILSNAERELVDAVHALSACRAFDYDLYIELCQGLSLSYSWTTFSILIEYSFVWPAIKKGNKWYRIHDLLRRIDIEDENMITRSSHQFLLEYYSNSGDIVESIYHINRIEWRAGINIWNNTFSSLLQSSQFDECQSLLDILEELIIKKNSIYLSSYQLKGDYFFELSRYPEAEAAYILAINIYTSSNTVSKDETHNEYLDLLICEINMKLGKVYKQKSEYKESENYFQIAVSTLDTIIKENPPNDLLLNLRGLIFRQLGDLKYDTFDLNHALNYYEQSANIFEEAIAAAAGTLYIAVDKLSEDGDVMTGRALPSDQGILSNQGDALGKVGKIQQHQGKLEDALSTYKKAIKIFSEALNPSIRDSENRDTLNNQGLIYINLASAYEELGDLDNARINYQEAIEIYKKILSRSPNDIFALDNQGIALLGLGKVHNKNGSLEISLQKCNAAITTYNKALKIAAAYDSIILNKAKTLSCMGNIYMVNKQHNIAIRYREEAIEIIDNLLKIAPNSLLAMRKKSQELVGIGLSKNELNEYYEATKVCEQALEICDWIDDNYTSHSKTINVSDIRAQSFHILGAAKYELLEIEESFRLLQTSLKIYQQLDLATCDKVQALLDKAEVYGKLARVESKRLNHRNAINYEKEAIQTLESTITLTQDHNYIHQRIGTYYNALSVKIKEFFNEPEQVLLYAKKAILSFEIALIQKPQNINILSQIHLSLVILFDIQNKLDRIHDALDTLNKEHDILNALLILDLNRNSILKLQINNLFNQVYTYMSANDKQKSEEKLSYTHKYCTSLLEENRGPGVDILGSTFIEIGNLYCLLGLEEKAIVSLKNAANIYNDMQNYSSRKSIDYSQLSLIMIQLGDICSKKGNKNLADNIYNSAISDYNNALDYYNQSLTYNPQDVITLNQKGITLLNLGDAYYKAAIHIPRNGYLYLCSKNEIVDLTKKVASKLRSKNETIVNIYTESLECFEQIISLKNDYNIAYINKSKSYINLANLLFNLNEISEASSMAINALTSYDGALKINPADVNIRNDKGIILKEIGVLKECSQKNQEALVFYQESVDIFLDLLDSNPEFFIGHSNLALSLIHLGNVKASKFNKIEESKQAYERAIAACDQSINIDPDYFNAYMNRSFASHNLIITLARTLENYEIIKMIESALDAIKILISFQPKNYYFRSLLDQEEWFLKGCYQTLKAREVLGDLRPLSIPMNYLLPAIPSPMKDMKTGY